MQDNQDGMLTPAVEFKATIWRQRLELKACNYLAPLIRWSAGIRKPRLHQKTVVECIRIAITCQLGRCRLALPKSEPCTNNPTTIHTDPSSPSRLQPGPPIWTDGPVRRTFWVASSAQTIIVLHTGRTAAAGLETLLRVFRTSGYFTRLIVKDLRLRRSVPPAA